MICKDCIHYEACTSWYTEEVINATVEEYGCMEYKDKSRFVELPCNFMIADLNCVVKDDKPLGKTIILSREEAEKALKEMKK